MLISRKDILNGNPPFLMESATGEWAVISKITAFESRLKLEVVVRKSGAFIQRSFDVKNPPFYVGADVWELDYGSVLMTLSHPSLVEHPAKKIWEEWLAYKCGLMNT